MRPPTVGPCNASPVHRSFGASASNRPNAVGGVPVRAGVQLQPREVALQGPLVAAPSRQCAAQDRRDLRRGPARDFASSAPPPGPAPRPGSAARPCAGLGTSASNPPRRQSRIHRSIVARETRTGCPNGPACSAVGQIADQPAPLLGGQRRVRGLPDQRIPEQPDLAGPASRRSAPAPRVAVALPCRCRCHGYLLALGDHGRDRPQARLPGARRRCPGSTRVGQLPSRRAGLSSRPPLAADGELPTPADRPNDRDRRGRGRADRLDRVGEHRPGHRQRRRLRVQRMQQPGEHHPDPLRVAGERAQPAPHRATGRPSPPRSAMTPTGRLRRQRGADHLDRVGPPRRHDAASSTCVTAHAEHGDRRGADAPRDPARTAGAGHAPTAAAHPRTPGRATHQRASARSTSTGSVPTITTGASKHQATALPSAKESGRAVALPGRGHALVASEEGQARKVALNTVVTVNNSRSITSTQPARRSTAAREKSSLDKALLVCRDPRMGSRRRYTLPC